MGSAQLLNDPFGIEAVFEPCLIPAFQQTYVSDTFFSEFQRHPGARRLVWSRTIEDDLAVSRNLAMPGLQIGQRKPKRPRDLGTDFVHFAGAT